jgi:hypothetical protein
MSSLAKAIATKRTSKSTSDTVTAKTPAGLPDVCVRFISPFLRAVVRAIKAGLWAFLGSIGVSQVNMVPVFPGGANLETVLSSSLQVALWTAFVTFLANMFILLTEIDEKWPEVMA